MRRTWMSMVCAAWLSVCLAGAADAAVLQLKSKDGKLVVYTGDVVRISESSVVFATEDGAEIEFPFADIMPSSLFRLRVDALAADDETGRLALAEFGIHERLLGETRSLLEGVIKLRGKQQTRAYELLDALRVLEAQALLNKAAKRLDEAEYDKARELCHDVMKNYSDTPSAADARDFIDEIVETERLARAAAEQKEKQEDLAAQQQADAADRARLDALLDKVNANIEQAAALRDQGLAGEAEEKWTVALKSYEAAEKLYNDSMRILNLHFLRVKFQRVDYIEKAKKLSKKIQKLMVRCLTEHTSAYIGAKAWKQALGTCNEALLLDPDDQQAQELYKVIKENYIHFSAKNIGKANESGTGGSGN